MALNYVSLSLDIYDGQGNLPSSGTATFRPSVQLTDPTDHEFIPQVPITVSLSAGAVTPVSLLATDNVNVTPSGWAWQVSFSSVTWNNADGSTRTGNPGGFSFFLPYAAGASQYLSGISPVSTAVTQFPANPMTTPGDMITGGTGGVPQRLAGNTTATPEFLVSTGSGGVATTPVLRSIQAGDLPGIVIQTTQPGTSYTLALTDAGTVIRFTSATAATATVPANATVAFAAGTTLSIYAAGAGGVTISPAAGVTVQNNSASLVQYQEISLRYDGSDVWVRVG